MTTPGGIFITGHDPDFHAVQGHNPPGAQHTLQRAVGYVTFEKVNPTILLVTDLRDPNSQPGLAGHSDPRAGLTAAGLVFDVADFGSGAEPGVLDLNTVDFHAFDCIIVASDHGGWLRQEELDILITRTADILAFLRGGGGLVVLNEGGNDALTTHDPYGFLPFVVSSAALGQVEEGFTVTPAGAALGLTDADVNSNASHSVFTATSGLDIIDVDADQRILSLASRERVGVEGVGELLWLDHFDLLPGDASVTTSSNAVSSGVGGGLTGLVVESSTLGEEADGGGNKVVHAAVQVPPGYRVIGVRVGYELTDARSFISQIRLAQVQKPPSSAVVLLDDGTDLTSPGPVYMDSQPTSIDPAGGPLLLSLRVSFGDTTDRIAIRGLALRILPKE